jgi:hypothetical protein
LEARIKFLNLRPLAMFRANLTCTFEKQFATSRGMNLRLG